MEDQPARRGAALARWCRTRPRARPRAPGRDRRRPSRSCAFLPPISSESRLCMRPQVSPILAPVAVDPVNEITGTSGCSTSAAPATSPRPCTSWITSGGSPASSRISTSRWAVWGTSSDGLRITALPQSSAGNVFQVGNRHRKVERRDEPGDADRPAVAHRPLVRQLRRHHVAEEPPPLGRGVVGGVDPLLHVAAGLRRAPCPSRGSSRRRSRASAASADRRRGAGRRPGPAPACATTARSRAWPRCTARGHVLGDRNRGSGR